MRRQAFDGCVRRLSVQHVFFFSVRFGGYTMPVEYRANFTLKCHGFGFVELCMKTFVETMQKMCEGINGMSKM